MHGQIFPAALALPIRVEPREPPGWLHTDSNVHVHALKCTASLWALPVWMLLLHCCSCW